MKYRTKPIVIEAFRIGMDARPDWFQDKVTTNDITTYSLDKETGNVFDFHKTFCIIKTPEGDMRGNYGDFIIQGVSGEIYTCKPDIFETTYEPV